MGFGFGFYQWFGLLCGFGFWVGFPGFGVNGGFDVYDCRLDFGLDLRFVEAWGFWGLIALILRCFFAVDYCLDCFLWVDLWVLRLNCCLH